MEQRLLALVRRAVDMRSDAELLALVQDDRVAFAELIARHGPMVWGVCRHMLDHADAEDAFQATFVALLRASIRDKEAVAAWLHAVAVRIALRIRREAGRRRSRERVVAAPETISPRETDDLADTMAVIHREVAALPEADRSAFVLCVVEGLTQAEAATHLGQTPGAIAGQVARAKKRLIARLTERGVVPGFVAALSTTSIADAVPPGLLERVLDLRGADVPPAVLRLAKGAIGMSVSSTKISLAAAVAVCTLLVASGLYLIAAPHRDKPAAKAEKPAEVVPTKTATKGRTWKGHVVERGTFKPIGGVQVVVTISADEDKRKNEPKLQRKVSYTTKSDGAYEFTITPEEAARWHLYVEVSITTRDHPEYYGGYGYSLVLKNEKLGVRPFYERIILWPGRTIEGIVKTPEGKPAAGVKLTAYTSPTPNKPNGWARFPETRTDKEGRFRFVVHAKQRAVLWILPQDYAPEVHNVRNDQRDLGTFTLSRGERLTGKLRDSEGKPVAGVYVEARPVRPKMGKNPLIPYHVANLIRRTTITAADGSFEFRPLPIRKYEVQPTEDSLDPSTSDKKREHLKKPLPAVFLSRTMMLKKGGTTVEMDAVPHVVLEMQKLNSKGEKREGNTIHLIGTLNGNTWFGSADSSPTGAYRILVPKGLELPSVSLIYDPDSAFQYRLKKDSPLQYGRHFRLGTLDHDMKGIEIINYAAPTIVISATTKDGKPIKDLLPSIDYTDPNYDGRTDRLYSSGKAGASQTDVPFENLNDGKVRTIQLVPDREVNVTVRAEGFKPASQKITLAEGKTKELKFVLEPK